VYRLADAVDGGRRVDRAPASEWYKERMATPVSKAVIPAAGLGTRFLPASKAQPKEMLVLVDKPAIQYVVEEAVAAGLTDVLIVTGRGKRSLEDHFDRSFELEHHLERTGKDDQLELVRAISEMADVHYIRQSEPLGLGHAVATARRHVGDQPFAVLLPDDIMDPRAGVLPRMLEVSRRFDASVLALKQVTPAEISSYGCATPEPVEENIVRVTEVVEKPEPADAKSDLAVIGRYVFTPAIFEALDQVKPGKGGEIQLTDAIEVLTPEVYGWTFQHGRFDVGNKADYLRATVELALERDDLGPAFRDWLVKRLAEPGPVA
jgi:UTP--glucose-1-phosphate uridylyltransferase